MIWKFRRTTQAESEAPLPITPTEVEVSGGDASVTDLPQEKRHHDQFSQPNLTQSEDRDLRGPPVTAKSPRESYVVPASYKITGHVVTHRPVVIKGELAGGSLVAPEVQIAAGGNLKSPTQAAVVRVSGAAWRPIVATDYIEVSAGGRIGDDIEAPKLIMHPGGAIAGARLAIGPMR